MESSVLFLMEAKRGIVYIGISVASSFYDVADLICSNNLRAD